MAASDASTFPVKGQAFRLSAALFDNTGALIAVMGGLAGLAAKVSIDGGTLTNSTNAATEAPSVSGLVYLDLTTSEMNGNTVTVVFTCTNTDANATVIILYPYDSSKEVPLNSNPLKWVGTTIPAPNQSGIPIVDMSYTKGTISPAAAGSVAPDWAHVSNPTTTLNLSGTTVGTVTTTTTATNLTNSPTAGDFTATMKTSLNSSTPTVPTAAAIAAATRDVNNTSPAANSLGAKVNIAATAGDPWATDLPGSYASGTAGNILGNLSGGAGSGAYTCTVTVSDGSNPVANATVRLVNGVTTLAIQTNGSGIATFGLDSATWAIAITKSGYTFTPTTIVVTGAANFDETITPVVIPAPPAGGLICNVAGYFEGLSSGVTRGVPITFTLSVSKAKSGPILVTDQVVAQIVNGQLVGPSGQAYVPLYRNDGITPAATTYAVTCAAIGFSNVSMSLTTPTFDLASLVS